MREQAVTHYVSRIKHHHFGGNMDRPNLTYRHWFLIALLVLANVVVFGFVLLAILGKVAL